MPSANEQKTVYTKDFDCLEGKAGQQQAILKKDNRIYNYSGSVDMAQFARFRQKRKKKKKQLVETFCLSLLCVRPDLVSAGVSVRSDTSAIALRESSCQLNKLFENNFIAFLSLIFRNVNPLVKQKWFAYLISLKCCCFVEHKHRNETK